MARSLEKQVDLPLGSRTNVDAAQYQAMYRLMDSLLHDARNPLNALAINLDVLAEKLKVSGAVPANQAKNLNAMRDQVFRVEGILRQFSDYLAPRPTGPAAVDFSDVVERAVEVLSYEARRSQLRVRPLVEKGIKVSFDDLSSARLVALQVVLRGLMRAPAGSEVEVSLSQDGAGTVLRVRDVRGEVYEPLPDAIPALAAVLERNRGELRIRMGECAVLIR